MFYRDQTPPTTPERVRSEAQQNERGQRVLESPEYHRTPHHVRLARSGVFTPAMPPPVFMPPVVVAPHASVYNDLPPHLAQQYTALSDLYPRRLGQASVAPGPGPQLAPAFVPAPAAPARYPNLPTDLAQRLAALPPLVERGRGSGRGRGRPRANNTTAPANAPLTYAEIAAQYANLSSVCTMTCFMFYFICDFEKNLIYYTTFF